MKHFLDFAKIDADSFVKLGNSEIEEKVMAYVVKLKRRIEAGDLSPNSINVIISPIQLFRVQNDVILNWKKIKRIFPRRKKPQNELPYTTEDIQKMLISTTVLGTRRLSTFLPQQDADCDFVIFRISKIKM